MSERKVAQIAEEVDKDPRTIKKWIKTGLVMGRAPVSVGDAWYVDETSLLEFISKHARDKGMPTQTSNMLSTHHNNDVIHTQQDILLDIIKGLRQDLVCARDDNQHLREYCASLLDNCRQLAVAATVQTTTLSCPTSSETPPPKPCTATESPNVADITIAIPVQSTTNEVTHRDMPSGVEPSKHPEVTPPTEPGPLSTECASAASLHEEGALPPNHPEEWLQIDAASRRLNIPKSTLRDRAKRNEIVARDNGRWEILLVAGQPVRIPEKSGPPPQERKVRS